MIRNVNCQGTEGAELSRNTGSGKSTAVINQRLNPAGDPFDFSFGTPFSYTLEPIFGVGSVASRWGAPKWGTPPPFCMGNLENGFWQPNWWPVRDTFPARPETHVRPTGGPRRPWLAAGDVSG
jgi:hypothetical protein